MLRGAGSDARARCPIRPVVISDEPYRAIVFDGDRSAGNGGHRAARCVTATSWSKAWAISGERIGYLAISPRLAEADALRNACTFTNRILGYINAPAIWQRVVMQAAGSDLAEVADVPGAPRSHVRSAARGSAIG